VSGILVVGVGNPLAGDDGIGLHVATALAGDDRLPAGAEVLAGGSDLLRHADAMRGRRLVVVIDAMLDDRPLGTLQVFDGDLADLEARQDHVHHLSVVQALGLLRSVTAALDGVPVVVAGVTIHGAEPSPRLSAGLEARVPAIADEVAALVRERARPQPA